MTKENFQPLYATNNLTLTRLLRLTFFLISLLFILPLYSIPLLLMDDITNSGINSIYYALYIVILTYLLYQLIKSIQKANKNSISNLMVDKEGLHYTFLNKNTEDILFKDLLPYKQSYTADILTRTEGIGASSKTVLMAHHKQQLRKLSFQNTFIFSNQYITNSGALRAHYIQGITLFRPDLKIDPSVFTNFHIHPQTFAYNQKDLKKALLLSIIFICVILSIIYYYF
ncbi:MAG: hypothetical protein LBE34_11935 [Flavobacteriaceae bacterium]|jgi:hypothetical protein|nr:hypothetical protein [Flavobacteriaceae bacterium]